MTAKKQHCGWKHARDARTRENRSPFSLRTFTSPLEMQQIAHQNTELCYMRIAETRYYVGKTSLFRDFFPLWGDILPYAYRDCIPKASARSHSTFTAKATPIYNPYATKLIVRLST